MKNIKVVIGTNFGDEGKGLMTDYYCEQLGGKVLNVRFNGTSQAGHTVERDGKRHVFSHFGSGSMLDYVATYLSSDFYFNPVKFFEEYGQLMDLNITPEVYICRDCEAITIYDIFFNCIVEESRGDKRHGSCGAGLWEAVNRKNAGYSIEAQMLPGGARQEYILRQMLLKIRDEYYEKRFAEMNVTFTTDSEWYDIWYSDVALENYMDLFFEMGRCMTVVDEKQILNEWDKQVYEGAQGLLLDYNNREYMPNLTASYTGSKNVVKLLNMIEDAVDIEITYVTRTYFTRHGAGRFETEVPKDMLDPDNRLMEVTNVTNRWQGNFRWGYFDEALFLKTIEKDIQLSKACVHKVNHSVAFTHTNCTDEMLLLPNGKKCISQFANELPENVGRYYCCGGKTAKTVAGAGV